MTLDQQDIDAIAAAVRAELSNELANMDSPVSGVPAAVRDVANGSPAGESLGADVKLAVAAAEAALAAVEGIQPTNGSGDTPVDSTTLDVDGDALAAVDENGDGIDDVAILAYVASEWAANPTTAEKRAETRSQSDTTWQRPLMLDAGTYTIVYSKSGWNIPATNVVVS